MDSNAISSPISPNPSPLHKSVGTTSEGSHALSTPGRTCGMASTAQETPVRDNTTVASPQLQATPQLQVTPQNQITPSRDAASFMDPFATPTPRQQVQKLSPTASPFHPVAAGISPRVRDHDAHLQSQLQSMLNPQTLSAEMGFSRHLVFSSATTKVTATDVEAFLEKLGTLGFQYQGNKLVRSIGDDVSVYFTDIRDACFVQTSPQLAETSWDVKYMTGVKTGDTPLGVAGTREGQVVVAASVIPAFQIDSRRADAIVGELLHAHAQVFSIKQQSSFQTGTYKAIVEYCDVAAAHAAASRFNNTTIEGIHIVAAMHPKDEALASHGSPTSPGGSVRQSQNIDEIAGGLRAMSFSNSMMVPRPVQENLLLSPGSQVATLGTPILFQPGMSPPMAMQGYSPGFQYALHNDQSAALQNSLSMSRLMSLEQHPAVSPVYREPRGRFSRDMYGQRSSPHRHGGPRNGRGGYYGMSNNHNHVDVHRIREGTDVRTTIMLRNIPNKVDQAMLKRIVDESSWGKYDFMYLRIDFANDCNVGYAFINFVDPLDIVDFVNARGNQRWNCFKSDKVAEISYATIQGKDCLVQKFRNSSVMLEAPHYRPKLYYTSNGPRPELAGQEESFPEPDNQSKMKRSCENAEHVGLFTPNAGQHFRDEQRRRRSQYDRGTRLAALDEYDYESAIHNLYDHQH